MVQCAVRRVVQPSRPFHRSRQGQCHGAGISKRNIASNHELSVGFVRRTDDLRQLSANPSLAAAGVGRERQHGAAGPADVGQKQSLSGQTHLRDPRHEHDFISAAQGIVWHRQPL